LKVITHGQDTFDDVIDAVRVSGGKISFMENLEPTLEDVFLHITGRGVRDSVEQKTPVAPHSRFEANRIR